MAFVAGHFHRWGIATLAQSGERRKHPYRNYGLQAFGLAVLVLGLMLLLGGGDGFEVALGPWEVMRVVIPTLGVLAAVPWIITVWWTHDDLARLREEVDSEAAPVSTSPAVDPAAQAGHTAASSPPLPQHKDQLRRLLEAWTSIERSTGAMAAIVSVGVLTTGALRLAIEADTSDDPAGKVPSEGDVLAYGLFFAVLVATVVVPLILSYRRRAGAFVEMVYLPENRETESEKAAMLAELLHLNTGPLVSPWALISVSSRQSSPALSPCTYRGLAAELPTALSRRRQSVGAARPRGRAGPSGRRRSARPTSYGVLRVRPCGCGRSRRPPARRRAWTARSH